jgi:hypothetical protein
VRGGGGGRAACVGRGTGGAGPSRSVVHGLRGGGAAGCAQRARAYPKVSTYRAPTPPPRSSGRLQGLRTFGAPVAHERVCDGVDAGTRGRPHGVVNTSSQHPYTPRAEASLTATLQQRSGGNTHTWSCPRGMDELSARGAKVGAVTPAEYGVRFYLYWVGALA